MKVYRILKRILHSLNSKIREFKVLYKKRGIYIYESDSVCRVLYKGEHILSFWTSEDKIIISRKIPKGIYVSLSNNILTIKLSNSSILELESKSGRFKKLIVL